MKTLKLILAASFVLACRLSGTAQEIPAYYSENGYIQSRVKTIPKGKSFIFITDTHVQRNAGNPAALPARVMARSKVGLTIFGGDCFDWAPDKEKAKEYLSEAYNEFEQSLGDRFLWIQGNHDCNSNALTKYKVPVEVGEISDVDAYDLTVAKMAGRVVQDGAIVTKIKSMGLSAEDEAEALAWSKMHYMYDDVKSRIRFIVMETDDRGHCTKRILPKSKVVPWQNEFLQECLNNVPKGYDVVVAGHMFAGGGTGPTMYETPWFKTALDYRLSGKGRIVIISGHTHVDNALALRFDSAGKLSFEEIASGSSVPSDAVLLVLVSCDANASYQKYAAGPKVELKMNKAYYPMKKGTTEEHCFDVVTFTKGGIAFTRIGAGADRMFNY